MPPSSRVIHAKDSHWSTPVRAKVGAGLHDQHVTYEAIVYTIFAAIRAPIDTKIAVREYHLSALCLARPHE